MNAKQLMDVIGQAQDSYIEAAIQTRESNANPRRLSLKRAMLIAAVIALSLLLVGCGVAYATGWLTAFFSTQSDVPLSSEQAAYIAEQEQIIDQAQTHAGWTVQIKSAITDGRTAFVMLGITAPEGTDLKLDRVTGYYLGGQYPDLLRNNQDIVIGSLRCGWEPDGDGSQNTMDYFIRWEVPEENGTDPFGPDVQWNIHFENILNIRQDIEYLEELLNGKYKGQENIMFTGEETEQLYKETIAAEGPWDFPITFESYSSGVELLSAPISAKGYASRSAYETEDSYEDVTITSFVVYPFSAVISHKADACVTFTSKEREEIVAVMNDGSQIELTHSSNSRDTVELHAAVPIVISEVDHLLLPDGTILPMP